MKKISYLILMFSGLSLLLVSCGKKTKLIGEVPSELQQNLTELKMHIPYYFPSRAEFGPLNDGVYTGKIDGGALDHGEINVTISGNEITDVEIVDLMMHSSVRKDGNEELMFEGMPLQVMEKQSPLVDAVSGATGTSHVFKICLTRALWAASDKSDPMDPYTPY